MRLRNKLIRFFVAMIVIMTFTTQGIAPAATTVVRAAEVTKEPSVTVAKKTLYIGYENYQIRFKNLAKKAFVTYKSSNAAVAFVSKKGEITPLREGTAKINITIKQNNKTYISTIAVTVELPYVFIKDCTFEIEAGESFTFKGEAYGIKDEKLNWYSSDPSVAAIDTTTGALMAKAAGTTTISLQDTSNKISSSIDLTVIEANKLPKDSEKATVDGLYCNVKDFGAIGDGVNDDTKAFNDALICANGQPVIVPNGIYNVNTITVTGYPVNLIGIDNPTLQLKTLKNYSQCLNMKNADSVKITGLTFDGERLVHGETLETACIWAKECTNVEISFCHFQNCSREATVFFGANSDINIHDNTYDNTSALVYVTDGSVQRLKFIRNSATNGRLNGVECSPSNSTMSSDILIADNIFRDFGNAIVQISQATDIIIRNNYVSNCRYLLVGNKTPTQTEGIYNLDRIFITDNTCENVFKLALTQAADTHTFKHYGTIKLERNKCICSGGGVTFNDVNTAIMNDNTISAAVCYELKNVGSILIYGDKPTGTDTFIQITGDVNILCKYITFNGPTKIFTVFSGTPSIKFEHAQGNFRDISTAQRLYILSAINCINISSLEPMSQYDSTAKSLTLPPVGDICKIIGQTTASDVTDILGLSYPGRTILIECVYTTTFKTTGNIVTKSGSDAVVTYGKVFSVTFYNNKWYEN